MIGTRIRGLFGGYSGNILLSLSLGWFAIVTGRLLLPPLLPTIIEDFGITLSAAGVVLTTLQAATAVVLFPGGRLSDQLSRATVVGPSLGIFAFGSLIVAGAPSYLAIVAGAATMGIGNGLFTISARALISDQFVEHRGGALGFFAAGFNIGGILASGIAIVVVTQWRISFLAVTGVMVIVGFMFVYWNREPFVITSVDIELASTVRRLVAKSELRNPIIAYSLFYIVTQSVLGFFPAYLQDVKGFSPRLASAGFALIFAVGAISKVIVGDLSDRFPRILVATIGVSLAMVALAGLLLADSVLFVGLLIVLFAVGHQAQFPLIDAILIDSAPDTNVGGDIGAARTIFRLVGSVGPIYVGLVAQLFSYTAAFTGLVFMLLTIVAIFAYAMLQPHLARGQSLR